MKYTSFDENELYSVVEPVCSGFNARVVHISSAVIKTSFQIRLVVFRKEGVDLDLCTKISRALVPKLEIWSDNREINLEVSSPGVGRTFKDAHEFSIFSGERAKVLVNNDWIEGAIISASESSVIMDISGIEKDFSFGDIQKAKLV